MKDNWTVYKHISPSGKIYVGITSREPQLRWGIDGKEYIRKRKGKYIHAYFARAILKYGWDSFNHEIVASSLSHLDACRIEKQLIKYYKEQNLSYNISDGGEGVTGIKYGKKRNKMVSRRMKEWHRTHESPMLGKHHTDEARFKITKNHRVCQTEKTRRKISQAQLGKKFPKWRKELLSNAHAKEKMPIVQLSIEGEFISEYESIMDASRKTGIHNSQISGAIKRKGTAKGFKWLNKKDYENQSI